MQVIRTALVPYPALNMYQLVEDVGSYPQFLSWCTASRLIDRGPGGPWAWGPAPTLADCCLVPQLYAAVDRYGLTLAPRLATIAAAAEAHSAFIAAHPKNQPDAPR